MKLSKRIKRKRAKSEEALAVAISECPLFKVGEPRPNGDVFTEEVLMKMAKAGELDQNLFFDRDRGILLYRLYRHPVSPDGGNTNDAR